VVKTCKSTPNSEIDYNVNLSSFGVLREHNHTADPKKAISKTYANKFMERLSIGSESNRSLVDKVS